jgi:hypothetical protein
LRLAIVEKNKPFFSPYPTKLNWWELVMRRLQTYWATVEVEGGAEELGALPENLCLQTVVRWWRVVKVRPAAGGAAPGRPGWTGATEKIGQPQRRRIKIEHIRLDQSLNR